MALNLLNLDSATRVFMLEEVAHDLQNDKLYHSPRLSESGWRDYPALLQRAVELENDSWLEKQLRQNGRLNKQEQRKKPKGGYTMVEVPVTAAETLAEGEFNRFYIRSLCRRAKTEVTVQLIVYRAKSVSMPRPESERMIGTKLNPDALLNDLRQNIGVDTSLGLPPGPNSGLSVRLIVSNEGQSAF